MRRAVACTHVLVARAAAAVRPQTAPLTAEQTVAQRALTAFGISSDVRSRVGDDDSLCNRLSQPD
jgi:hypothetical protein